MVSAAPTGVERSFAPQPAPFQQRPVGPLFGHHGKFVRYSVALILVSVLAGLRYALGPWIGMQAPLLPFMFAVFAAAYACGFGPALMVTFVAPIIDIAFFEDWSTPHSVGWASHLALFVVLGCLVAVMMRRLELAYRAQVEALAAASAGEARLRLITDALPVLIAYVDADQRYAFNSSQYEQWFGQRANELRGRHMRDVLGDEAYEVLKPRVQAVLEGEPQSFELEIPYRDAARHVHAHYVPDRAADGAVRGFFALVEDVSERKRGERALADARLRLSLALRVARSGTFDWDIPANRNTWSDEMVELHGILPGEFGGTHEAWLKCVHPDDLERVQITVERALKEGEIVTEYRIRRRDTGEQRWIHSRGKVFYDADGKPSRMVGINVDVTEQKRAEEALREADRHKDNFLAMLAHELRNPLAPIRNVAHVLSDERTDGATIRRCGELVQRQVGHLAGMVDDLLDAARIRRGQIEIKRERVELNTVIERAIEMMQSAFVARRQMVNFARSVEPVEVMGDAVRLEQVCVNLLSNASKYSPDKTMILIAVEPSDGQAVMRVRDEGVGIDPQNLPRIFDLFVQADQSLDRSHGGLGIGLTIVKRIVELHQGSVEARSAGLGCGSEFIVRMPLRRSEIARSSERGERAESKSPVRRVLIVEDNADSAESLQILLAAEGHQVRAAGNGREALQLLELFAPEWVFADIGLPVLDGYSLVELMRRTDAGRAARIYAVTGYGQAEDRELALKSGFDGHLTKPVDPEALLHLLAGQSSTREAVHS